MHARPPEDEGYDAVFEFHEVGSDAGRGLRFGSRPSEVVVGGAGEHRGAVRIVRRGDVHPIDAHDLVAQPDHGKLLRRPEPRPGAADDDAAGPPSLAVVVQADAAEFIHAFGVSCGAAGMENRGEPGAVGRLYEPALAGRAIPQTGQSTPERREGGGNVRPVGHTHLSLNRGRDLLVGQVEDGVAGLPGRGVCWPIPHREQLGLTGNVVQAEFAFSTGSQETVGERIGVREQGV